MQEPVGLRLELPSLTENVAVVRAAISGMATATGLEGELSASLKTAVSEACNNVCLHAYPEEATGPMLVEIECLSRGIQASVRDAGHGITATSSRSDRMGLGLAVIHALSDRAEFRTAPGGGTEVRILFNQPIAAVTVPPADPPAPGLAMDRTRTGAVGLTPETHDSTLLAGAVRLWCNPAELQRHVLARMLMFIAASAHFSLSSVDDLADATDAIADYVRRGAEGWVGAGIESSPRCLRVTVGPLDPVLHPGNRLLRAVQSVETEPLNGHRVLRLTITDRQRD
jgi:serine/threonine-protein kinase RsbW